MSTQTFDLAPNPSAHEWGQAFAFALPPAAGIYVMLHWMLDDLTLGLIAAPIVFIGIFLCAILLIRPQTGALELDASRLRLVSGSLDVSIPFADIDVAAISTEISPKPQGASLSLITDQSRALCVPLRSGGLIAVSPLEPSAFVSALRNLTSAA